MSNPWIGSPTGPGYWLVWLNDPECPLGLCRVPGRRLSGLHELDLRVPDGRHEDCQDEYDICTTNGWHPDWRCQRIDIEAPPEGDA